MAAMDQDSVLLIDDMDPAGCEGALASYTAGFSDNGIFGRNGMIIEGIICFDEGCSVED